MELLGNQVMTTFALKERETTTQPVCSVHPAALVFPEMSPADLDGLVEDIKQNGLAHPIVRTSDGVVLDGRNRLKACEIAGIDPQFEVYEGSNPVGFIISSNLKRRQLNESQRALIVTRLATLARGQHQTAFESAEKFQPPNDQMRKFADSDSGMTQAAAAAALNVSKRTVLAAVKNHTFFGDGQAKGSLGEMPSAAVGTQSRACIPVNRGSAGNPPCDAPSGWTATERTRSADLAVLSTVTSRTKR